MAVNKVVFGNETLIDLTADSITPGDLRKGVTAHDKSGNPIEGTNENDSNTQDADATEDEVLAPKTFYARGVKGTGRMVNNGAINGSISEVNTDYTIPLGFHDGSGKVSIDSTEKSKLIPGNIKSGISILGVTGNYGGESIEVQPKEATPSINEQVILPDEGYDYLSQVTVKPIPRVDSENSAGGITTTIG